MTKAELVSAVALQVGSATKNDIAEIIDATMATIEATLANGENVYLRGFGSFNCKVRKEKVARNIRKQQSLIVPEHTIPAFKPSKEFIKKLN